MKINQKPYLKPLSAHSAANWFPDWLNDNQRVESIIPLKFSVSKDK